VDIEESNNFDKNYLFKDLLKTIAENAPTLDQIDSLLGVHFCPHATIWPLEHLNDIRKSIRLEIEKDNGTDTSTKLSETMEQKVKPVVIFNLLVQ
jgi:hypothetical protein